MYEVKYPLLPCFIPNSIRNRTDYDMIKLKPMPRKDKNYRYKN